MSPKVRLLNATDCFLCEQMQRLTWQLSETCTQDFLSERQFRWHLSLFPQGQLALETKAGIVAHCSTLLTDHVVDEQDDWYSLTGFGNLTTHDPSGKTLFIVDICTFPNQPDCFRLFSWRLFYLASLLKLDRIVYGLPLKSIKGADPSNITEESEAILTQRLKAGFEIILPRERYRAERFGLILEKRLRK